MLVIVSHQASVADKRSVVHMNKGPTQRRA